MPRRPFNPGQRPSHPRIRNYARNVAAIVGASALLRLWLHAEDSGTTLRDASPNSADKASAYTGVTLGQTGPLAGHTATLYDGATSYTKIHDAALQAAFDPREGTFFAWAKVASAGVWTDAANRFIFHLGADTSNRFMAYKTANANELRLTYLAGGTAKALSFAAQAAGFFSVALTWSKTADVVRFFYQGTPAGSDAAALGTWAGAINNTYSALGSTLGSSATQVWNGTLGPVLLATRALTPADILNLHQRIS